MGKTIQCLRCGYKEVKLLEVSDCSGAFKLCEDIKGSLWIETSRRAVAKNLTIV